MLMPAVVVLASCSAQPTASSSTATAPVNGGEVVTVLLSNFVFDPDHIRLQVNKLVRLRLDNDSSGGHSFSALAFFAASSFLSGSSAPADGTHSLHDLFGMTGGIEVVP